MLESIVGQHQVAFHLILPWIDNYLKGVIVPLIPEKIGYHPLHRHPEPGAYHWATQNLAPRRQETLSCFVVTVTVRVLCFAVYSLASTQREMARGVWSFPLSSAPWGSRG